MSVYFARVRGYVKIGYSANVWNRLGTITTGACKKPEDVTYGDDIQLLGWIQGDRKVEKAMHKKFADLNVIGEWFWDDDAFDELIAADEFSVTPDLPGQVVSLMAEYPHVTRARIIEVWEQVRADRMSDPTSELSQMNAVFPGAMSLDWTTDWRDKVAAEQAADRAYWRSQREVAA